MANTWHTKSQDDAFTVLVEVNSEGEELGNYRYIPVSGEEMTGNYRPTAHPTKVKQPSKFSKLLNQIVPISAGFLSGILLEATTKFLKLR